MSSQKGFLLLKEAPVFARGSQLNCGNRVYGRHLHFELVEFGKIHFQRISMRHRIGVKKRKRGRKCDAIQMRGIEHGAPSLCQVSLIERLGIARPFL